MIIDYRWHGKNIDDYAADVSKYKTMSVIDLDSGKEVDEAIFHADDEKGEYSYYERRPDGSFVFTVDHDPVIHHVKARIKIGPRN